MNHGRIAFGLLLLLVGAPALGQESSERFRRWDRNGDGKATREELPELLRPAFDRIDANRDGSVSPDEEREFSARLAQRIPAASIPSTVRTERDLPYAGTDNPRQKLDLYLPKNPSGQKPLPLVAFIHGGGWRMGDKGNAYRVLGPLVESGKYVCASIGYRLTDEATWPAQIHDCKAAIRWLRGNAEKYNIDPDRIGVIGPSAGGHLVAMLGTSGDVAELEGTLGDFAKMSSRVQCVVDEYGPTDLMVIRSGAEGPVAKLLGGPIDEKKEAARSASPVSFVSRDDPPFLIIHGTKDPLVRFHQSELLQEALQKAGVEASLIPVTDGGHGNFRTAEVSERIGQFFGKHLLGQDVSISAEPIAAGERPAAAGQ